MMAEVIGRNHRVVREVRRTFRQGLWSAVIVSVPAWALLWHTEAVLLALGQEPRLAADAHIPVVTISLGAGADTSIILSDSDETLAAHTFTGTFTFVLHRATDSAHPLLTQPRAETPTHYISMGINEDLDQAMEKVAELRSSTGARLNTIEAQRNNNEDSGINLQTLRSNLEDVDLTAAISKLAQQTTALEAAQAAFVRVQDLSLFDYL